MKVIEEFFYEIHKCVCDCVFFQNMGIQMDGYA